ncbi:hypothetical protein [Methyloglobulus sp.]|uniref:hypothetical protein n=1 Tax=Methyloglobulus sp. TaxID=2518622 RepID=UPI0032B7595C
MRCSATRDITASKPSGTGNSLGQDKSGVCLPRRQVPVQLPEDPLQGARQERSAGVSLMALANVYQARATLLAATG